MSCLSALRSLLFTVPPLQSDFLFLFTCTDHYGQCYIGEPSPVRAFFAFRALLLLVALCSQPAGEPIGSVPRGARSPPPVPEGTSEGLLGVEDGSGGGAMVRWPFLDLSVGEEPIGIGLSVRAVMNWRTECRGKEPRIRTEVV